MTFDFDSVISDMTLKNNERTCVNVYRFEEDSGLCPLWGPGAAAVSSAHGHWDQMYDFKHST